MWLLKSLSVLPWTGKLFTSVDAAFDYLCSRYGSDRVTKAFVPFKRGTKKTPDVPEHWEFWASYKDRSLVAKYGESWVCDAKQKYELYLLDVVA